MWQDSTTTGICRGWAITNISTMTPDCTSLWLRSVLADLCNCYIQWLHGGLTSRLKIPGSWSIFFYTPEQQFCARKVGLSSLCGYIERYKSLSNMLSCNQIGLAPAEPGVSERLSQGIVSESRSGTEPACPSNKFSGDYRTRNYTYAKALLAGVTNGTV
jgi:hypothetical protein